MPLLQKTVSFPSQRVILSTFVLFLTLGLLVYLSSFKILDGDFWWHVKAGRTMRETGRMITVEPFAYTREGEPYLARHEWLAQLFLSLAFDYGGASGVILLRTGLLVLAIFFVLLIDPRSVWLTGFLGVFAATSLLPGLTDRPQLFSFALFSGVMLLSTRILEDVRRQTSDNRWLVLILFLPALQVIWVNVHGAAAMLTFLVVGALICQVGVSHRAQVWALNRAQVWALFGVVIVLLIASFLSPNGFHNVSYLWSLASDRTVGLIQEWAPRAWGPYIRDLGVFWIGALAAIALGRRDVIFSLFLLSGTGILSWTAVRHEPFFVLAAVAVITHQCTSIRSDRLINRYIAMRTWMFTVPLVVLLSLATTLWTRHAYAAFAVRNGWAGYGVEEGFRPSVDFLVREGLSGERMFNTLEAGSYLLYRLSPPPRVFVDGRNVEYGYAFLRSVLEAGQGPAVWAALEERYGFTVAFVQYDAYRQFSPLPYVFHLQENAGWALVYADDVAAIYVRRTPEHQSLIGRLRYRVLRPELLLSTMALVSVPQEQYPALERELTRASFDAPRHLRARLVLAKLYTIGGFFSEAETVASAVLKEHPGRYEPLEVLGMLRAAEGKWREAGTLFERAITAAGGEGMGVFDLKYLADVWERAEDVRKAASYRRKSGRE